MWKQNYAHLGTWSVAKVGWKGLGDGKWRASADNHPSPCGPGGPSLSLGPQGLSCKQCPTQSPTGCT